MFGLFRSSDSSRIDSGIYAPSINRMNMGRLFVFNLLSSGALLVLTLTLGLLKLNILPAGYQTKALLIFSACQLLSAGTIFCTSRTKNTEIFDKICYAYIGVFSVIMFNFAFRCTGNAGSLFMTSVAFVTIGLLPILRLEAAAVVWGVQLIPTVILAVYRSFSADTIVSLIIIGSLSIVFSCVMYSSTIRKFSYLLDLDSVKNEAETDPMTRLLNRRGLERRIENIWPHCIRQHTNVAVLMMDIDNFKKYNDTFGHDAGDDCIRYVSTAMRKAIKRSTDYAARVGGEEFLILLTGVEPKFAVKWAVELKNSIDELRIPHSETNFNPFVSLSIGVACATVTPEMTFEKLREEADKSLYDAKNNGKACVYYHHKSFGRQNMFKKKIAINE